MSNKINVPELSLILLVGCSSSGKSFFAQKHFKPTEVISSDYCRGLVSDDENDQSCTTDAFDVLNYIIEKRLKAGKLTVVDATNVQPQSRASLIQLARKYHVLPVAIVLDINLKICLERNVNRSDRRIGKHVILNQHRQLKNSLTNLKKNEGMTHTHVLTSIEEINTIEISRQPTWTNKRNETGPFDIIGDIHGCFDELIHLIQKLGYIIEKNEIYTVTHPENRRIVFVGDLVDRGPNSPEVLRFVMDTTASGIAFCVNGNHDNKLKRKLTGINVNISHGLQETLDQLENETAEFKLKVINFLKELLSHYVFDDGKLAVAHAGIKKEFLGRGSPQIRDFCMYGETTGEIDEFGLPIRHPWANEYRGETLIVYGHTPIPEPEWLNNTINIDTGCVFGGKLTALRYPEKELVSVDAVKVYCKPVRPVGFEKKLQRRDNILNLEDVFGKRIISTKLHHNVTIQNENSIAALEIMARFAVDPRWLIYLPPTMSPTETYSEDNLLEYPSNAFSFYKRNNVEKLICQEKHMGSRAIVVVCKDNSAAKRRFDINSDEIGSCYTRTGRSFFNNKKLEQEFLTKIQHAISKSKLWERLNTDWLCLDTEIMPWSAKAQTLIEEQYAAVGSAAEASLTAAKEILLKTLNRDIEGIQSLYDKCSMRLEMINSYRTAYRQYCWPINSLEDYKIAPFHILAHENIVNMDKDHLWHMDLISKLCEVEPNFIKKTEYKLVDLLDDSSEIEAIDWWLELTKKGGEGIVIKPLEFTISKNNKLIQPAIKCRGSEYLRIIYGPEYNAPENIDRLRQRNVSAKRSLALKEYALGYESLTHFVNKSPLYKVHEAVFGILALESEPIDPRL